MLYDVSMDIDWVDAAGFLNTEKAGFLSSAGRMLLLSDGSLTRLLNAMLMSHISLQRLRQEEVHLSIEMGAYIGEDTGQLIIDRDIWLLNGQEKLVYANSILPTSFMRDDIYYGITKGDTPIGTLLREQSMLTMRDRLQFATIRSAGICGYLDIPKTTSLWARRYRLLTEGGFKGAIMEVFSPVLLK